MPGRQLFCGKNRMLAVFLSVSLVAFSRSHSGSSASASTSNRNRTDSTSSQELNDRESFAGDAACGSCHSAIANGYLRTAHHLTSQIPSENSVTGKFAPGSNTLRTYDPNLHFVMTAAKGGYYETAVFWQPPDEQEQTERIDLVIGSGQRGQTYLYWKGDRLFQLPVSFWAPLSEWVNSPGYTDGTADFTRPVVPRCLECHATHFTAIPSPPLNNRYRRDSGVLGISCERCHGPGREHVALVKSRLSNAQSLPSNAAPVMAAPENLKIVNPVNLPRERQIEVCAQCHGGLGEERAPAFSYTPGQPLESFLHLLRPDPSAKVDVHGNQVALLERSRCFQNSSKITCNFCHDVHTTERAAASYSDRCLTCHKPENCGMYPKLGAEIANNCIDCHMPVQDSNAIVSNVGGKQVKMQIRSHWIKIYSAQ